MALPINRALAVLLSRFTETPNANSRILNDSSRVIEALRTGKQSGLQVAFDDEVPPNPLTHARQRSRQRESRRK